MDNLEMLLDTNDLDVLSKFRKVCNFMCEKIWRSSDDVKVFNELRESETFIKRRIMDLRKAGKQSYREIAQKTGAGRTTVRKWENIVDGDTIQERRELADESNRKLLQRDLYEVATSGHPEFTSETAIQGRVNVSRNFEACEQVLDWLDRWGEAEPDPRKKRTIGIWKKRIQDSREEWYGRNNE